MTLIGSTVSNNGGYGINNFNFVSLTNSTVSNNIRGIIVSGTLTLNNSTVSDNSAPPGAEKK